MSRSTADTLPALPSKKPDWMSSASWNRLQEQREAAMLDLRAVMRARQALEDAKRLSDLSLKHYQDSVETLTQHTIDEV